MTYIRELTEIRRSNNRNEQKMELTMLISFISSVDCYKTNSFFINSNNVEITQASGINDILAALTY